MADQPQFEPTGTLCATTPTLALEQGMTHTSGTSATPKSIRALGSKAEPVEPVTHGLEGALNRVESMRTRAMATFGVIVTSVVAIGILLIGRDPVATGVHLAGLGFAGFISLLCLWRLRGSNADERPDSRLSVILGVSCALAAMTGFYYWGIFSAVIIVVPVGAFLLGQSRTPRGAWIIATVFLAGHFITALLLILGILEDRAINPLGVKPMNVQFLRVGVIQVIMACTFWVARRMRLSSRDTILKLDAALQALSQRDALLAEAARERDEARLVNVPGRYTGKLIGTYELNHVIGRGAMGVVYEALDKSSGGDCAVKVLHPHVLADPEQFRRFCQELKIAKSIDSPYVVKVFQAPVDDQRFPFMAMERLRGSSLSDYLSEHPTLPIEDVLEMILQIGDGLQAAHSAGIVHRDLKPRNLFRLDPPQGNIRWKILDFGTCKRMDQADATLTEFGHVIGTPAYMAPEQARGARVDYRADLYSLALVAYRALTGRPAFSQRNIPDLLYQVVHEMPPRPSQLRPLHADVDRVFAIALAKRSYERFASIDEFRFALQTALDGRLDTELRHAADALIKRNPWTVIPRWDVR